MSRFYRRKGRSVFVIAKGPACHKLRFAIMEGSVVLSRSHTSVSLSITSGSPMWRIGWFGVLDNDEADYLQPIVAYI